MRHELEVFRLHDAESDCLYARDKSLEDTRAGHDALICMFCQSGVSLFCVDKAVYQAMTQMTLMDIKSRCDCLLCRSKCPSFSD